MSSLICTILQMHEHIGDKEDKHFYDLLLLQATNLKSKFSVFILASNLVPISNYPSSITSIVSQSNSQNQDKTPIAHIPQPESRG